MRRWAGVWATVGAMACGGSDLEATEGSELTEPSDPTEVPSTTTTLDTTGSTGSTGSTMQPTSTATPPFVSAFDPGGVGRRIEGAVTWAIDFGPTQEADGAVDCSYTRTYAGIEDRTQPWLCPDCDVVFRVEVAMTDPDDLDCYSVLTDGGAPAPEEWIGWSTDGRYFRSGLLNVWLGEQGTADDDGGLVTVQHDVSDPDNDVTYAITGDFTPVDDPAVDPWHGMEPSAEPGPSACGWPRSGLPTYEGDHALAIGATLPDGYFQDTCGDTVRLHDFAGGYLVVDMAAMDCGPCHDFALGEGDFIATLQAEGIEVEIVTLLAPSLAAVFDPTTDAEIAEWVDAFDLHTPVFSDRGWGLWAFDGALNGDAGYPSYALVAPDLEVLAIESGYGATTFDRLAGVIRAHQASAP